jgi:hypothetical protein
MGVLDTLTRCREGYRSIFHYWESEKYRGVDEQARQEILNAPTIRELKKLSRQLPETWRGDWKQIRGRVFRSALLYAIQAHPDLEPQLLGPFGLLDACGRWGIPPAFVKTEIAILRREISEPFKLLATLDRQTRRLPVRGVRWSEDGHGAPSMGRRKAVSDSLCRNEFEQGNRSRCTTTTY